MANILRKVKKLKLSTNTAKSTGDNAGDKWSTKALKYLSGATQGAVRASYTSLFGFDFSVEFPAPAAVNADVTAPVAGDSDSDAKSNTTKWEFAVVQHKQAGGGMSIPIPVASGPVTKLDLGFYVFWGKTFTFSKKDVKKEQTET